MRIAGMRRVEVVERIEGEGRVEQVVRCRLSVENEYHPRQNPAPITSPLPGRSIHSHSEIQVHDAAHPFHHRRGHHPLHRKSSDVHSW